MKKTLIGALVGLTMLVLPAGAAASLADLELSGTDSPDPVALGSDLTYTYTLVNHGADPASTVELSTAVPGGTTFQSFSAPSGWTTTTPPVGGSGGISATKASVSNGNISLFTLVVHTSVAGQLSNTAAVNSPIDNTPNNNSVTLLTTVLAPPAPTPTTTTPAAMTTTSGKKCKKRHHAAAAKRCKKKR